jgi:hypothetical protein
MEWKSSRSAGDTCTCCSQVRSWEFDGVPFDIQNTQDKWTLIENIFIHHFVTSTQAAMMRLESKCEVVPLFVDLLCALLHLDLSSTLGNFA